MYYRGLRTIKNNKTYYRLQIKVGVWWNVDYFLGKSFSKTSTNNFYTIRETEDFSCSMSVSTYYKALKIPLPRKVKRMLTDRGDIMYFLTNNIQFGEDANLIVDAYSTVEEALNSSKKSVKKEIFKL